MTTTLPTTDPVSITVPEEGSEANGLDFYLAQIPDEFAKLEATIKEVFKTGQQSKLSESRVQGWIDEMLGDAGVGSREGLTGTALEDQLRDDIAKHVITKEVLMDFYGISEEDADKVILGGNEGGINFSDLGLEGSGGPLSPGGSGSYISGGDIVKIDREGQEPLWGVQFNIPGGINHVYTFGSEEEMFAALGDNAAVAQGFTTISEDAVNAGDTWIMGDAAVFAGQEGSYGAFWDDLVNEVALGAGIEDPGRLGDYVSDPEVARLMAEGQQAGWTAVQLQAKLRKTDYYLNTLYPGIQRILDQGDEINPEAAWKQYHNDVEGNLRQLGYEPDEDGSYAQEIGRMLELNIKAEDFATITPIYNRAQNNPELFNALDFWMEQEHGRPVEFDDLFDAIAGLDSGDLSDVIEKATIQFHANKRSTILTPEQITRLADLSDLSEQQIAGSFTGVEETLLALGAKGLRTSGLTEQALVDAAFDINEDGSAAETRKLARKAILERGLSDDRKAQFFQSFDSSGKPFRPGLTAGAPERG